ncbi:MAG: RNA polymerase sigma factor [Bacteroides sp.]
MNVPQADEELVKRLKAGDEKAFDVIYHLYAAWLYNFCRQYLKSHEATEELVEDVFVWLWTHREQIHHPSSFSQLLFLRTRHYLMNAYRAWLNSPVYEEWVEQNEPQEPERADDRLCTREFGQMLDEMLLRLTPAQRKVFVKMRLQGQHVEEVAEGMGVSKQTVKNQLGQALKSLKEMLKQKKIIFLPFGIVLFQWMRVL